MQTIKYCPKIILNFKNYRQSEVFNAPKAQDEEEADTELNYGVMVYRIVFYFVANW
jgi:hypothetical protein